MNLENFFTSGWQFSSKERDLRSKFQMMNIAIVLSSVSIIYGIVLNTLQAGYTLALFECCLFLSNIFLWFLLRKNKDLYNMVSIVVTAQFTTLLVLLIYISSPEDMKHSWFFTYPIIILYFKNEKYAIPWFFILIFMLLFAPLQPFIEIQYSFFQLFYLSFVLCIESIIVYFYKIKMDEARELISSQEQLLTKKIEELTQKDKMLTQQSKQAVMGEMISMIAHQWRQPLSTVTLSISNIQLKKLLGEKVSDAEIDTVLDTVSNTVVYLSETIDDFKTYFKPNKEIHTIKVDEILTKVFHFVEPRMKNQDIVMNKFIFVSDELQTYANELIQVLLNIINNAIDELIARAIPKGKIDIIVKDEIDSIVISIADNAGGIKQKDIETIFEPYVSTKGKNGTGLGLYMSQMIMQKQFNSKIELKTNASGSIFIVRIAKKLV